MANSRTLRSLLPPALTATIVIGAAGCAGSTTARDDYYQSRSIVHASAAGDGSVIVIGPGADGTTRTATLAMVPLSESGDLAASE